jgi:predicted branched-subunit amino acid permease
MVTTQQASKQPHEESHGFFLLQNVSMYMIWSIMISIGIVPSQKKRASSSWLRPTDTLILACVGVQIAAAQ